MNIGTTLRILREKKRFSQEEISHLLNISQKTYSNIENDKTVPSMVQLAKLSEILEFDLLDILKEQGITFNQNNSEFNDNSGSYIVNNFSEKLVKQYETIIKEKDRIIALLEDKIRNIEKNKK